MSRTQDETLAHITRTIVEGVHPRRIVLFGSRARGEGDDESDYDIMVEMESDPVCVNRSLAIHRLFALGDGAMDIVVFTPDEVRRRKDVVGTILYDIEREGRVLYARIDANGGEGHTAAESARGARVRERPPDDELGIVLREWMERANDDVLAIEALVAGARVPWPLVCYHAQQLAEKLLKAFLVHRAVHPPRTHNLADLLTLAVSIGAPLERLYPDCALLASLAERGRYPDSGPRPDKASGLAARDAALRVREALLALLPAVEFE